MGMIFSQVCRTMQHPIFIHGLSWFPPSDFGFPQRDALGGPWYMGQNVGHLVGGDWNMNGLWLSHHIGHAIIPTDELHHFPEGLTSPTSHGFSRYSSFLWLDRLGMVLPEGMVKVLVSFTVMDHFQPWPSRKKSSQSFPFQLEGMVKVKSVKSVFLSFSDLTFVTLLSICAVVFVLDAFG